MMNDYKNMSHDFKIDLVLLAMDAIAAQEETARQMEEAIC